MNFYQCKCKYVNRNIEISEDYIIPTTFPLTHQYNDSTEESESDTGNKTYFTRTNAFGEPKTTRHNRPPRQKNLLAKRERIPTRKSKHICAIEKAKKQLDKVSSYIQYKCT